MEVGCYVYLLMFVVFGVSEEKVVNFAINGKKYALKIDDVQALNATDIGQVMVDFIKKVDGVEHIDVNQSYEYQVQQEAHVVLRFIMESGSHTIKAMSDFNISVHSKFNGLSFKAPCGRGTYQDLNFPVRVNWWGVANYSDGAPGFRIGRYCSIGQDLILILDGNHCYSAVSSYPWDSQPLYSPAMLGEKYSIYRVYQDYTEGGPCPTATKLRPITIGNDVWIGAHVTIMMGVTIGDGAVIGAYSVVRSDVEPYSIVFGNPAVFHKYRFDAALIPALLNIKWWDWPVDKIAESMSLFTNYSAHNIEWFIERAADIIAI